MDPAEELKMVHHTGKDDSPQRHRGHRGFLLYAALPHIMNNSNVFLRALRASVVNY
jgi:hypothetical protein